MAAGSLMFITGGARSGKSTFAEQTAAQIAEKTGGPLVYLACGVASDDEMRQRIKRHQNSRLHDKLPWTTLECPVDIKQAAREVNAQDIILLDCLTTLLNNELFQDEAAWEEKSLQNKVTNSIKDGILAIQQTCQTLLIVSNEVLNEPARTKVAFTYGKMLGELHQWIVRNAETAFLVESGIPVLMKTKIGSAWLRFQRG